MSYKKGDDVNELSMFSDSEDETEDDNNKEFVSHMIQEATQSVIPSFNAFLSDPSMNNNPGDPTTNIVDRYRKKCLNINTKKIPIFFKFLETSRLRGMRQMFNEKQLDYSGIMLDFDIKQKVSTRQISHLQYIRLCQTVSVLLAKYLLLDTKIIKIGFTTKPKPKKGDGDYYKDGFHMLIPGIKVTRAFKRLLISELKDEKIMSRIFSEIEIPNGENYSSFMDENSSFVPVFFVGNASKPNSPPYQLTSVYDSEISISEDGKADAVITEDTKFITSGTNLCHEFSLNWQKPKNPKIIKKKYEVKSEYYSIIQNFSISKKEDFHEFIDGNSKTLHGRLSLLSLEDSETDFIKQLLDILHPDRAVDYKPWFGVMCALANTSRDYKPLAEYFSKKSSKFDPSKFETDWENAISCKNKITIGSIHFWAKEDNSAKYDAVMKSNITSIIERRIHLPENEGQLGHSDLAEMLHMLMRHKFVFDIPDGSKYGFWYEYIITSDQKRPGEVFKWRKHIKRHPPALMRFIHYQMVVVFRTVLLKIRKRLDKSVGNQANYVKKVFHNFQNTMRSMKNSRHAKEIIATAENYFEEVGFSDRLDKDPQLMGVGNGVLKLGENVELLTGCHGHKISKFTEVNWIPYNPNNPTTQKVLKTLRGLFPDNEPDTFNWIMHYLASTLDGRIKDSMIGLLVGRGANGKTVLVELHKSAIGQYAVKMPMTFLTTESRNSGAATHDLMQLLNARFAYYSESPEGAVINERKLKEVTGGETLYGRNLNEGGINFKAKSHHLCTTNHEFRVNGVDHGIWRRIKYILMKITFLIKSDPRYNPEDPNQKLADTELQNNWISDARVQSSYLSILSYYYESLMKNFKGKLSNVPCPNIDRETNEFRNRQDKLNDFLTRYMVKTEDPLQTTPLRQIGEKYIKWRLSQNSDDRDFRYNISLKLLNSSIKDSIKSTAREKVVVGCRALGLEEPKEEKETWYFERTNEVKESKLKIKPESVEEYYSRMLKEFEENKKYTPKKEKNKYLVDSELGIFEDSVEYDDDIGKYVKEYEDGKKKLYSNKKNNIEEIDNIDWGSMDPIEFQKKREENKSSKDNKNLISEYLRRNISDSDTEESAYESD